MDLCFPLGSAADFVSGHSPEFDEERKVENLRREVTSLGIRYAVVTDNDYQTWSTYHVEAWPTTLFYKQGGIRWKHEGEGDYDRGGATHWEATRRKRDIV